MDGDTSTEATSCATVTIADPDADPADAVIVAVPLPDAVTTPAASTVATELALVVQVTATPVITVESWSRTSVISCAVAPSAVNSTVAELTLIDVGRAGSGVAVAVGVGVGSGVAVAVGVGSGVAVAVGVDVGVSSGAAVAVGVGSGVAVAVGVGAGVGAGVGVDWQAASIRSASTRRAVIAPRRVTIKYRDRRAQGA